MGRSLVPAERGLTRFQAEPAWNEPERLSIARDDALPGAAMEACDHAAMSSFVSHTSVDCTDAYALSRWCQAVLDYVEDADDPNEPGHEECLIRSRDGHHGLLFIEVPEAKRVKNRVHLDLRPREGLRDDELARLLALGATVLDDRRNADRTGWVVLADPEGNEFDLLRSQAEVAATGRSSSGD